jgi:hypothetical protein
MTSKLFSAALISLITFASCGGDNKDVVDKSLIPTDAEKKAADSITALAAPAVSPAAPATSVTIPANATAPAITTQPVAQPTATVAQPQAAPAATTATAPGMNPPHGQPGHRCDISVGAPLNSKPNAPAAAPTATIAQPQAAPAATTATAPGMNPPHGQPGHRCDISVGAPLNSKPNAPVAAPTATISPVSDKAAKPDSGNKQ